jgi:pyridoxamine 5'-phosphate oxidase family protein
MRSILGRVAFVVDDVLPPWQPRGIEVRAHVEALPEGGKEIMKVFVPEILRLTPTHIVSWGINDKDYRTSALEESVNANLIMAKITP